MRNRFFVGERFFFPLGGKAREAPPELHSGFLLNGGPRLGCYWMGKVAEDGRELTKVSGEVLVGSFSLAPADISFRSPKLYNLVCGDAICVIGYCPIANLYFLSCVSIDSDYQINFSLMMLSTPTDSPKKSNPRLLK